MPAIFFKSFLLLFLFFAGSLAAAAEKRDLAVDPQLLAQAKQLTGQNSANFRALFGLSQREDLGEIRSNTDKNGVTHTRYRQTLQGVPVWGEQIIISRDRSGAVVGLRGTLITGLANELPRLQASLTAADVLDAMKDKVKNGYAQAKGLFFKNETSELVVYLDNSIPKLSYSVSFFADAEAGGQPTRPYFIVDAISGEVLLQFEGLTHAATPLPLNASNLSGSISSWIYYEVTVAAGQKAFYVTTSGSNGDADLYIRRGSAPTTSAYDCRSIGSDSNESCVITNPQAGTWWIGIYAYRSYNGLTLSAKQFDSNAVANGSGPGGNLKTREYSYGPGPGIDYPQFTVLRDPYDGTCILNDDNVKTVNLNHSNSGSAVFVYNDNGQCFNAYNTTNSATINGAYAPLNDAHYFGGVVYDMYQEWLGVPPLTFQLTMRVHYSTNYENAFWNGSSMTFGDGYTYFYPLVSLDVSAHEVSHGFTEQNSGLIYSKQSGGINEAFSDMAGEAAEYYMRGSNDFMVGYDIRKSPTGALRYMCNPPQDGRSIDNAADYYNGLDVHYSSGVFNKAFCLLAESPGWDTQKAFETFAFANMNYWTPSATFVSAARGVYDAACDSTLNTDDVVNAFALVGVTIDTSVNPCNSAGKADQSALIVSANPSTVIYGNTSTLSTTGGSGTGAVTYSAGASTGCSVSGNTLSVTNVDASGTCSVTATKAADANYNEATSAALTVNLEPASATMYMHIGDLSGVATPGSRGKWNAAVTIAVHGANHNSLANATVSGTWSNGANGSGSCTTDSSGTCSVTKNNLKESVSSVTFTVNTITHSSYTYDSSKNDVTPSVTVP